MGLLKRSREEEYGEVIDHTKIANYLMFLSHRVDIGFTPSLTTSSCQYSSTRVFQCKTCSRQFPSFQALGGHRASHKRPRLMAMLNAQTSSSLDGSSLSSPRKPKTHECNICGLEFAIGQALGGHMRRHRSAATKPVALQNTLLKTTCGNRNIVCMDLNLTPLENEVELRLGGQVFASMVG